MIESSDEASSRARGRGAPVVALLGAAVTSLAFQASALALVDSLPSVDYLAFGAGVTLVAALAVGGAFAATRPSVSAALAAWAAIEALFFFPSPRNILLAAAFAAATGALLARSSRTSPAARGVVVGGALCLTLVVFPKALLLAWSAFPEGARRDALRVATFAALVASVPVVERLRRERPRIPDAAAFMLVALAAAAAATPSTWKHRPWIATPADVAAPAARPADAPCLLLLVLDTVRADHLGLYGYERDTTPELARFVARFERARVYPLAFSPAPWTVPAHASLLTGLLPSAHGAHSGNVHDAGRTKSVPGIRAERTLAEELRSRGYATAGIFANVHLAATRGLERGFDVWFQPHRPRPFFLLGETVRSALVPWLLPEAAKPYPPATSVREDVLRFVDAAAGRPWFVLANFMEAHQPYAPRAPFAGRFAERAWNPPVLARADDPAERIRWARDRYDEEIASLDAEVGRLLAELDARGALDRTWIVITSDHGEAFGERGTVNHGSSVYNEQIRVPLIVVPPAGAEVPERAGAVSLVDVPATLAAIAGGGPLGVGVDLRHPPRADDPPARAEFFGNPAQTGPALLRQWGALWNTPARAAVWSGTKLVELDGRRELYDLASDPGESDDLAARRAASVEALMPLLPPLTSSPAPPGHALTDEQRDALRALGYAGE